MFQRRLKSFQTDRFRNVIVHSYGEALFPVFLQRVGGHGHNPRPFRTRPTLTNLQRGFEPIHFWHLDVQKNPGRTAGSKARKTSIPSVQVRIDIEALEHPRTDPLVHRVIVRQQDSKRQPLGQGRIRDEAGGRLVVLASGWAMRLSAESI